MICGDFGGLYPSAKPFSSRLLRVCDVHSIYLEEYGNRHGIPVLFVHRGPGAVPMMGGPESRFFNPEKYRLIIFHQRGAGKSLPHGELAENNTANLISDMEHIREVLDLSKVNLVGVGWGAALAVAYAQNYPERVKSMVLQGFENCRKEDVKWLFKKGANEIFPDAFEQLRDYISEEEHGNLLHAYYRRLNSSDEGIRLGAARRWLSWFLALRTMMPCKEAQKLIDDPEFAFEYAQISTHYFMHKYFMEEGQLLNGSHRLRSIPGTIVHGRYDVISPVCNAYELHEAWLGSELVVIPNGGHCYTEEAIAKALLTAIEERFG